MKFFDFYALPIQFIRKGDETLSPGGIAGGGAEMSAAWHAVGLQGFLRSHLSFNGAAL